MKPGFFLKVALMLPSCLFAAAANLRAKLYDSGYLETIDTGVSVISIGNLTAGGTGKTPITSYLTGLLRLRGFDCAIISRGYRATAHGPAIVEPGADAAVFGDEPVWLAAQHPDSAVVIGAKRPEAIAFLKSARAGRAGMLSDSRLIVLADDAFQHRRLNRQLDIVILDATEPRSHYWPLPMGRMRENFAALERAHFIFISKINLAEPDQLTWLRQKIRPFQKPTLDFNVALTGFVSLHLNQPTAVARRLSVKRVVLMSGIARPQTFKQLVHESQPELDILRHFVFVDHATFSKQDLDDIETQSETLGAEAIVLTEKDAVKLRGWRPRLPCYVSRMVAVPLSDFGEFNEAVDRFA